jgi:adenylylsulfate kinase
MKKYVPNPHPELCVNPSGDGSQEQAKPSRCVNLAENHVVWHDSKVKRIDRNRLNKHMSGLIWFTGLPGAGKSSIAHGVEQKLYKFGIRTYVLDGDNIRYGLNADLGFERQDRKENIRRIVEVCKLLAEAGILVLTAFVSPYAADREFVRNRFAEDNFWEIYVKCTVEECTRRDIKGHYLKAQQGIIKNFTGVSAPYEVPQESDLVIDTESSTLQDSVQMVVDFILSKGILSLPDSDQR